MHVVELLKLVQSGDNAALEMLVLRFRPLISRLCQRECIPEKRKDLQGILQLALVEAIRSYGYKEQRHLPGYLKKWLFHATMNYQRKEQRLREKEGVAVSEGLMNTASEDAYENYVLMMDLREALSLLNEEEKKLIKYHLFYDYTWEEIGRLCQSKKATVYSRYRKGMLKLQGYFLRGEKGLPLAKRKIKRTGGRK